MSSSMNVKKVPQEVLSKLLAKYGASSKGGRAGVNKEFWDTIIAEGYAEKEVDTVGKAAGLLKMAHNKGYVGKTKKIEEGRYGVIVADTSNPTGKQIAETLGLQ